jgi:hypothetical protein
MFTHTRYRRTLAVGGVFFAVAIIASGVLFLLYRDTGSVPTPGAPASTSSAVVTFDVYFHKAQDSDPSAVVALPRTVSGPVRVVDAAVAALLAGPTDAERAEGYWSHFSTATADRLNFVRAGNQAVHADFRDFSAVIPNASSSAGSAALLAELDATLMQFGTAATAIYSFDGDVAAFYEWLQRVPPTKEQPGPAKARQTALKFASDVIGLENPTDDAFRSLSPTQAEVDLHSWIRSDEAATRGPLTTVTLGRDAKAWTVTGARTGNIRVASPSPSQATSSPLTVTGEALAWEGVVTVRIVQAEGDKVTELGRGSVTGGGDRLRPFSGPIRFTKPDAPHGWALFTSASGHNGETIAATAIPIMFAGVTAPPQVTEMKMLPETATNDGWISLHGSDMATFMVRAKGADRVRFFLNPAGDRITPKVISLGVASRNGDEFTLTWHYQDEPLLAHLSAVLSGPGGSVEHLPFGLYHP